MPSTSTDFENPLMKKIRRWDDIRRQQFGAALTTFIALATGGVGYCAKSITDEKTGFSWWASFFSALDVRNDATALFFDGKHLEANCLEVSCLRSSDAHQASDLGSFPSWVQMEVVSFAELKAALPGTDSAAATEKLCQSIAARSVL